MYYDKLLPKSVIEKHPLAKHGYLFPAKSKKAGQLVFANPDYIIDYTWDDDMTHKQSISNATQKINEMQVKKFFSHRERRSNDRVEWLPYFYEKSKNKSYSYTDTG